MSYKIFEYPNSKHIRSTPAQKYKNYRNYKKILRIEFRKRCVYCTRPDYFDLKSEQNSNFHVDHYRPQSLFDHLKNDYANLFYSCECCNNSKKDYWPKNSAEPKLLNPCDFIMNKHVRYEDDYNVVPLTSLGRFFIKALKLQDEDSLMIRRKIIFLKEQIATSNEKFKKKLGELNKKYRELKKDKKYQEIQNSTTFKKLEHDLKNTTQRYHEFKEKLSNLYASELLDCL